MGDFKHSKYKNIGIIFELLTKQVVNDILSDKKTNVLSIIKRNFRPGSELSKELVLYRNILEFNKKEKTIASKFLDIILQERHTLDLLKLKKERYKLLGEIKNAFSLEEFFNSRVTNYKLLASIYKLFEHKSATNPSEYVNCYEIIVENITSPTAAEAKLTDAMRVWESQPEEIKQLAFSLVIEKFNGKYKGLKVNQKTLISRFINENPDSPEFKDYILNECKNIRIQLGNIIKKEKDPALNIKLRETANLLNGIITARFIKEEHLTALLTYYELIETLK